MILSIMGLQPVDWSFAQGMARKFIEEFPDRKIGSRHAVLYNMGPLFPNIAIYKTKEGVTVRLNG